LIDAGMDAVITKPIQPAEIFGCLSERLGTRFVFRDDADESAQRPGSPQIIGADLAGLSREVRESLEDALILLDSERISAAVREVTASDPEVGDRLRILTEALAFEAVLHALDEASVHDT
jgi:CheY-like chemotaxis protein